MSPTLIGTELEKIGNLNKNKSVNKGKKALSL